MFIMIYYIYHWKWSFIVDLPIKKGDFPYKSPFSHGFPCFSHSELLIYQRLTAADALIPMEMHWSPLVVPFGTDVG